LDGRTGSEKRTDVRQKLERVRGRHADRLSDKRGSSLRNAELRFPLELACSTQRPAELGLHRLAARSSVWARVAAYRRGPCSLADELRLLVVVVQEPAEVDNPEENQKEPRRDERELDKRSAALGTQDPEAPRPRRETILIL